MNRTRATMQVFLNHHVENMNSMFKSLYKDEKLADVTLYCRDGSIKAHKLILAACSSYFQEIFLQNKTDNFTMFMHGVTLKELENLIDLIYKGATDVFHDNLDKLYDIAEDLKINGLSQGRTNATERNKLPARQPHSRESHYQGFYQEKRINAKHAGRDGSRITSQNSTIIQQQVVADLSLQTIVEENLTLTSKHEQSSTQLGRRRKRKVYKFKCKSCPRYCRTLRDFNAHNKRHEEQQFDGNNDDDFDIYNTPGNSNVDPSETLQSADDENAQMDSSLLPQQRKQRRQLRNIFKCKLCSSTFRFLSELNEHERKHNTQDLYNTLGADRVDVMSTVDSDDDDDLQIDNEILMDTAYEIIVDDRGSPLLKRPIKKQLRRHSISQLEPKFGRKKKVGHLKKYPKTVPLEIFEAHWNSTFNSLENGRGTEATLEVENSLMLQSSVTQTIQSTSVNVHSSGDNENIVIKQGRAVKEKTLSKLPRSSSKQDLDLKFTNPVVVLTHIDSPQHSISEIATTSLRTIAGNVDENVIPLQSKGSVRLKCRKRKSFNKLSAAGQKLRRLKALELSNKAVNINTPDPSRNVEYENSPILLPEMKIERGGIQTTKLRQEVTSYEVERRPVRPRRNQIKKQSIEEQTEVVPKRRGRKSNPDKEAAKGIVSGRITKRGRKPGPRSSSKLNPEATSETLSRRGRKSGCRPSQKLNATQNIKQETSTSWLETKYTEANSYNSHSRRQEFENDSIQSIINRTVQNNLIHLPQHPETSENQRTNQLVLLKTEYLHSDADIDDTYGNVPNTDGDINVEQGSQQIYYGSLSDLKAEFFEHCNDSFILQTSGSMSPSGSMYLQVLSPTEEAIDPLMSVDGGYQSVEDVNNEEIVTIEQQFVENEETIISDV